MELRYVYDVPLPNSFAATTQILRTGAACAAAGHRFSLAAGLISAPAEEILRQTGADPAADISIDSVFPDRPRHRWLRPLMRAAVLRREMRSSERVLISRGETALAVAAALGPRHPKRPRFVLEIHKLLCLDAAERQVGQYLEALPNSRLRRLEARAISRADGLIFLTEAVRTAVQSAFETNAPWVVAPSGVEVPVHAPDSPHDIDLVFAGKIEARKGVLLALEMLAALPMARLRLIGDGADMDQVRHRAAAPDLADRVEIVGRVPHSDVARHLARGRVGLCLLPAEIDHVSACFSSPMKLLEMMALGLPVVASDTASVRAVCTDGVDALLVPPDDPACMAAAAARLLEDKAMRKRLGAAARARAKDFSWERRAQRIAGLCQTVDDGYSAGANIG